MTTATTPKNPNQQYLSTNAFYQVHVKSQDVVPISINTVSGPITIFNIYNDGNHADSLQAIWDTLEEDTQNLKLINTTKMIWAGDFNLHHPLWDEEHNSHLFTIHNLDATQTLIDLLTEYSMTMTLSKNIPTLWATCTKNLTRPDNVFCGNGTFELITQCMTLPHLQPPCTDHFPIMTTLNISMAQSPDLPKLNWQQVDWGNFCKHLVSRLNVLPTPMEIQTLEEFNTRLNSLTTVINTVVAAIVPCTKPSPFTKRWWTRELSQACSMMRREVRLANKVNNDPSHPSHQEYRLHHNAYTSLIRSTKKEHWTA